MRMLPDFNEPPVIETVLGLQFDSLESFSIPHFGLYWFKILADYPKFNVQPPLTHVVEQFGEETRKPYSIEMGLAPFPELRCWFVNDTENRLIQIQKDRFIYNWRKIKETEEYPHYDYLKPKFIEEWNRFCQFLEEVKLGNVNINQCEITYVNHIDIGKGWKSYGDLNKVFSCWSGDPSVNFLPEPEMVSLNTRYVMPEKRGRLYIIMQPGIRRHDAKEILQLQLIARGKPASSSIEDIMEWFDLGHEWIVKGFTDFTTDNMHEIWGRKI